MRGVYEPYQPPHERSTPTGDAGGADNAPHRRHDRVGSTEKSTALGVVLGLIGSIVVIAVALGAAQSAQDDNQEESYQQCLTERRATLESEGGLLSPEEWCDNLAPDSDD